MKIVRTEDDFLIEATKRGLRLTSLRRKGDMTELPNVVEAIKHDGAIRVLGGIWFKAGLLMDEELEEYMNVHNLNYVTDWLGIFFDTEEDRHIVTYMGGPQ